jgi:hypothetical protein
MLFKAALNTRKVGLRKTSIQPFFRGQADERNSGRLEAYKHFYLSLPLICIILILLDLQNGGLLLNILNTKNMCIDVTNQFP